MAGRIPREFIDELLARTDVVSVVGGAVSLRRTGANYKGLCPFHDERTPSFIVSPDRQTYHCFGCGAHGNAIGFLIEHDGLPFLEAVEELAQRQGMSVPDDGRHRAPTDHHEPIYRTLEAADRFYRDALRSHPARRAAVDYLRRRGITGEVAARFGLGFAPPGWDNLLKQSGAEPNLLVQAGLAAEREGRTYDRLRDRITFPIRDRRGRVVGFGGRVVGDGEPKYLNSPETAVFHKGREVYGLYEATQDRRRPEQLVVVEGYMDVIALAQHGVDGAVATLGTATTGEQAQVMLRAAPRLVLCFDGDQAGRQAAWRAMENLLPALRGDREVAVLLLPEGEDPDSLVRAEGADAFQGRLRDATPVADFFFQRLAEECDPATVDGRARLLEKAAQTLRRLPEGAFRQVMVEQLAALTRGDPDRVEALLTQRKPATGSSRPPTPSPGTRRAGGGEIRRTPVRLALALLLRAPSLAEHAGEPDRFADRPVPGLALLQQLLELARREPQITTARVLERFRGSEHETALWKLADWDLPEGVATQQTFLDALMRIEEEILNREQQRIVEEMEADGMESPRHQEALRKAQRLQLLMERHRQGTLDNDGTHEMETLKGAFRL